MSFPAGDGAKTTIWTRGSETVLNFVHAAKQRRRTLIISAIVVAVVACVVAFAVLRYLSAQQATRVVSSYGALSHCLLGEPLKDGEKASVRFRAVQLTALRQAEIARASGGSHWPERCAIHAYELNDSLSKTDLGDEAGKPLVASAKALSEALEKKGSYSADLSAPIDKAFDDARAAQVALVSQPGAPSPPPATEASNIDTIGEGPRLSTEQLELGELVLEPSRSGTVRFLATAEARKAKPVSCTFRSDKAQCIPFPKTIAEAAAAGLSLLGTADEDGAALVFAARGEQGIFRSDSGVPFEAAKAIGGYSAVDGFAVALTLDGDRLQLLRSDGDDIRRGAASPGPRLDVLQPERDAQLLWGHVLFVTHDDEEFSLVAAPVDPKGGLGQVEEIGGLEKEPAAVTNAAKGPRIDGCHTAQAVVARVRIGRVSYLSFRLGNRWTKPVKAGPAGGALTCNRTEAVITQVGSQGGTALTSTITQHVCSPTACERVSTVMSDVLAGESGLAPTTEIAAVGLGGKVLIVWQAGERGGVRMRFNSPSNLANWPDVVLFDSYVEGGVVVPQSTVLNVRVLPAEDFAIVLLNTTRGVFALRVNADGKATPVAMSK